MDDATLRTLLRWIGQPIADDLKVNGVQIATQGIPPVWAAVLVLAGIGVAVWSYHGQGELRPARRGVLVALRALLLASLAGLLLQPVLLLLVERYVRGTLVILLDTSASMAIQDGRTLPEDLVRAAIADGRASPLLGVAQSGIDAPSGPAPARWEVVRNAFRNEQLDLLARLQARSDVELFTFGRDAAPQPFEAGGATSWDRGGDLFRGLTFRESRSALGDALRQVLEARRGEPLAGILLISDGASNAGLAPLEAADLARQDDVPVFTYGVGITAPRDVSVSGVDAPEVAFIEDAVPVTVRVRSINSSGRTARLVARLGGEVVAETNVRFDRDGEQSVDLRFTPKTKGDFDLVVELPPQPDEAERGNNTAAQRLRIIDRKVRVLLVESQPRWEHRFVLAMLQRDRRLEVRVALLDGDPGLGAESGGVYLPGVPSDRETLLNFDAVVLGDLNVGRLSAEVQQNLVDLVSRLGGAVVFLAGPDHLLPSLRGTPLEPLLPVELPREGGASPADGGPPAAFALALAEAGRDSPVTRLGETREDNLRVWAGLPGVTWVAPVARARPGAEVLVRDGRGGPDAAPVVALQGFGMGTTAFLGTDQFWRWRRGVGERYHTRFWGQLILRVTARRTQEGEGLVQLATERTAYTPGERVVVTARVFRAGYEPATDASFNARMRLEPDGPDAVPFEREVVLSAVPGRPGMYRGEFVATQTGEGVVTLAGAEPEARFVIEEPRLELADPAMNEPLLRAMAEAGGGRFLREEDLHAFPDALTTQTVPTASPLRIELGHSLPFLVLLLLFGFAEWILRKIWRLK